MSPHAVLIYCCAKLKTIPKVFLINAHRIVLNGLLFLGRRCQAQTISEDRAAILHGRYPRRDVYKYDDISKKRRAAWRFNQLCSLIDTSAVKNVAELGAGDGQLALLFAQKGYSTVILDLVDWRDEEVRRSDVRYVQVTEDNKYELPDKSIDLFVAYGTFEHVRNPASVLKEALRVTRSGGHIFLLFGPLYNSPWGLHAYETFYAPYPQFLLSKDTMRKFIDTNGIWDLGVKRQEFQYVNGWAAREYHDLITSLGSCVNIKYLKKVYCYDELGVVYRHLRAFLGRKLNFEELTTEEITLCLEVRNQECVAASSPSEMSFGPSTTQV